MKRIVILSFLVFAIILILALPASAQRGNVIGVIDTQAFMRDSQSVQEQRNAFMRVLEEKRVFLRSKQEEVQKLEREVRTAGSTLSVEDRTRKNDELAREVKEFNRLREDLAEETRKKDEEITRRIIAELNTVIEDYRKKNKYTLIMERRLVAAYDESVDITADIIKAYDTKKQ